MQATAFPRSRSKVALLGVALVVAAAGGLMATRAASSPRLPSVSPDRLLASTIAALSNPISLSGRVAVDWNVDRHHKRRDRQGGELEHTAFRVWRSSAGIRVAQILDFGERLVVADRDEAWLWDSATLTANRLPSTEVTSGRFDFTPSVSADPFALAGSILRTFAPYSDTTVIDTATVAGRPVYELSLRSEQRHTHLRKIVAAIDSATRLPLELQLYTRRITPAAIDVRFTSISFGHVDPSLFQFSPPTGATVVDTDVFSGGATPRGPIARSTKTFGRGWKTVVAWELSRGLSTQVEDVFPLWNAVGSALTTKTHGRTWILAGFVSLTRLERVVPKLP
jgi:outer membrane lipoprotein-sorting protein